MCEFQEGWLGNNGTPWSASTLTTAAQRTIVSAGIGSHVANFYAKQHNWASGEHLDGVSLLPCMTIKKVVYFLFLPQAKTRPS